VKGHASHVQEPVGVESSTGKSPEKPKRGRFLRFIRHARWYLLGLIIFLALVRLALPFAVEDYVNRQLNKAHDYGGRVGNIHLQLWRGRYRIDNIRIYKRTGEVKVPLFAADHLSLAIEWKELFHGSVVGQAEMQRPRVNFVSGPTAAQSQTGTDEHWDDMLKSLFPFNLNRVEINRGQIHFQNEYSKPPVDIYLNEFSATATNLNNSRKIHRELPAGCVAHATTIGGGDLDVKVQLNPMAHDPTYQVDAQLTNVDLTALNSFLKAYGKFDVERGVFGIFTSVASKDGDYTGYIKVFFNNLKVFAWEKEKKKNPLQIAWEATVGSVATLLKNQPKDSLATRVPISGSYKGSHVGVLPAIGTLLRNAFIRALIPSVDQKVTLKDVEQKSSAPSNNQETPPPPKDAPKTESTSPTDANQ
jgi:hypothetical protein